MGNDNNFVTKLSVWFFCSLIFYIVFTPKAINTLLLKELLGSFNSFMIFKEFLSD